VRLSEVEARLRELNRPCEYHVGQLVYDLTRDRFRVVAAANTEWGIYRLCDRHVATASELEDPLRESYRRETRAALRRLQARVLSDRRGRRARLAALTLAAFLAAIEVGALTCWAMG